MIFYFVFFFSSRRRHTRFDCDWSSDVCSSDLDAVEVGSEALIDDELVRVVSIDPVAATLTVARGCVDTVPVQHAVGTRVWFTDEYVGFDGREYLANEADRKSTRLNSSHSQISYAVFCLKKKKKKEQKTRYMKST